MAMQHGCEGKVQRRIQAGDYMTRNLKAMPQVEVDMTVKVSGENKSKTFTLGYESYYATLDNWTQGFFANQDHFGGRLKNPWQFVEWKERVTGGGPYYWQTHLWHLKELKRGRSPLASCLESFIQRMGIHYDPRQQRIGIPSDNSATHLSDMLTNYYIPGMRDSPGHKFIAPEHSEVHDIFYGTNKSACLAGDHVLIKRYHNPAIKFIRRHTWLRRREFCIPCNSN